MWQYNYTPDPDELYHWGVKGMKWKKRKVKTQLGIAKDKFTKYVKGKTGKIKREAEFQTAGISKAPKFISGKIQEKTADSYANKKLKKASKQAYKALDPNASSRKKTKSAEKAVKNAKKAAKGKAVASGGSAKQTQAAVEIFSAARKVRKKQKKASRKKYTSARMK